MRLSSIHDYREDANYFNTDRIYPWKRRKKKGFPHTSPAKTAHRTVISAEEQIQASNKRRIAAIWRAGKAFIQNGMILCFKTQSQMFMPHQWDGTVSRRRPAGSTGSCYLAREKTSGRGGNTCFLKALWSQQWCEDKTPQFTTNLQKGGKTKSCIISKAPQLVPSWELPIGFHHFHTNSHPKATIWIKMRKIHLKVQG